MATNRVSRTGRGAGTFVDEIVYAGLGAAALASDQAEAAIAKVGAGSRRLGRTLARRFDGIAEEVGSSLEEAVPAALRERANEIGKDLAKAVTVRRKGAGRALASVRRELSGRGRATWSRLSESLGSVGGMISRRLQPVFHGLGLATTRDLARLEARLDGIARELDRLEGGE